MAITINGSGTITGVSAGGLPDGCVDNDTIATGVSASKLTGTLPALDGSSLTGVSGGKVVQVVQNIIGDSINSSTTTTTGTWLDVKDANNNILQASITPSSTSNKILITVSAFTRYFTGTTGHAGQTKMRILRNGSAIFSEYDVGYAYTGGNIRYGSAWTSQDLDSPSSTSSLTYKIQYNFDGNQTYHYGINDVITLMEIEG